MMTLKGLKGGPAAAKAVVAYCEHELVDGKKDGYYSKGSTPSVWGGSLATELGLEGLVRAADLQMLLEGRLPDGSRFAPESDDRRMAVDMTFSAPKSVSEYALCQATPEIRDKILAAHDRAVAKAMAYGQANFVSARYGKGGAESVKTGSAIWAAYRHEDARPVDGVVAAQIHSHCVNANVTRGKTGELRALDWDFGPDGLKLMGAVYRAELANALRNDLGLDLRKTEEGFELEHVSDEQIELGSPRRQQIDEDLERKGLTRETSSGAQRSASNLATRESKIQQSQVDQRWSWRAFGRAIGLNVPEPVPPPVPLLTDAKDALAFATDHLSERASVIDSQSVKLQALLHGMHEGVTVDALESEIANAQETGDLLDAGAGRLVTRETLEREASILATVRAGRDTLSSMTDNAGALARISTREKLKKLNGFEFTQGQRESVLQALTTRDQFFGIRGVAGGGKSTALAALSDEAHARGMRVVAVGPSQTSVDGMSDANPDDARVLASFNSREDKDQTPRLILMDEAGMVSAHDMEAFLQKVRPTDYVRFIGDDLQLAAIEAGSPFAQMMKERAIDFSEITEINRQKDAGLLAVAQAFADGRSKEAVVLAEPYMTSVAVTDEDYTAADAAPEPQAPSASELGYEALEKTGKQKLAPVAVRSHGIARATASAYLKLSPEERAKTLVMAATHDVRRAINARIRDGLQNVDSVTVTALDKSTLTRAQLCQAVNYKCGQVLRVPDGRGKARKIVDWTVTATDPTRNIVTCKNADGIEKAFHPKDLDLKRVGLYTTRGLDLSPGDRILFTENNRGAGFQNNETGTVTATDNGVCEIRKDDGKTVTLDADKTHTLDHGWAVTVHRSQGRTVDRALVAGMSSKRATANLAYVACSRERWHLQIFTDNIKKLQQSWTHVADRETALDATRATQNREPDALQTAREVVRSQIHEQQQQEEAPEVEQDVEHDEHPEPLDEPEKETEKERELGDSFYL
ncbi:MobF family relaxase [Acidiferrobacter sp.]